MNAIDAASVFANTKSSDAAVANGGEMLNASRSTGTTKNPPPSPASEPKTAAIAPVRKRRMKPSGEW